MKAFELIDKPEKWTKKYLGRDAENSGCEAHMPQAVCWCAMGAILKVACMDTGRPVRRNDEVVRPAIVKLAKAIDPGFITKAAGLNTQADHDYVLSEAREIVVEFNNSEDTTYEMVIAKMKEADV